MEDNHVLGETVASGGKGQPSQGGDAGDGGTSFHTHPKPQVNPRHRCHYPRRSFRESQPTSRSPLCVTTGDMAQRDPGREAALCELSETEPEPTDTPSCLSAPGLLSCSGNRTIYRGRNVLGRTAPLRAVWTPKHWQVQEIQKCRGFWQQRGLRSLAQGREMSPLHTQPKNRCDISPKCQVPGQTAYPNPKPSSYVSLTISPYFFLFIFH